MWLKWSSSNQLKSCVGGCIHVCVFVCVCVQPGERETRGLQPCGGECEDSGPRAQLSHLHHEQLYLRSTIATVPQGDTTPFTLFPPPLPLALILYHTLPHFLNLVISLLFQIHLRTWT